MDEWMEEILKGVEEVPIIGTPGSVVVYGSRAQPILSNTQREVLVAAAEYGQGRVAIFAHDGYTSKDNFSCSDEEEGKALYKNIRQWLTKGRFNPDTKVLFTHELGDDIPEDSLVIWDNGNASDEQMTRFDEYIQNGGAMVIGLTPWGYLQITPNSKLETIPANIFTKKMGVCFTTNYFGVDGKLHVSDNQAKDSHLIKALTDVVNLESFCEGSQTIQKNLRWLPDEEFCEIQEAVNNTISKFSQDVHCCPAPGRPVKSAAEKAMVIMMNRALETLGDNCSIINKIPSVKEFPGDVNEELPLECADVTIQAPTHGMQCFHPTGYYVSAGLKLVVNWKGGVQGSELGWKVAIGTHTDELFHVEGPWSRWPSVQVTMDLTKQESNLKTSSGGLVYFISDGNTKLDLNVSIENVVQAPFFDIADSKSQKEWLDRRNSPGLWADLVGHHFMISLPASSVRNLDEPAGVTEFWDHLAETHFSLAGVDLKNRRREWIVTDLQPRAGYMHAGYPIVTGLDVANPDHEGSNDAGLLNISGLLQKGSWGMFHELGHNLQDPMWTFSGTGEVTCNIFTLHGMDVICGQKPWIHSWLENQIPGAEKYLKEGANFAEGWQHNAGVALVIYAQLARDFGWDSYKKVFAEYCQLRGSERPTDLQDQIDQWIIRFSKAVEHNLCPLFQLWGFPVSDKVRSSVGHFPPHMPSDEVTSVVPERVEEIMKRYPYKTLQ